MALRWYTTLIDARDPGSLARWWAETLDWRVAYESDDEVLLIPGWATPELVASTPFHQVPPGLGFVKASDAKATKNRLHLDLAPHVDDDRDAIIAALLERGAERVEVGQPDDASWDVLADPEGNEFCVLSSRTS